MKHVPTAVIYTYLNICRDSLVDSQALQIKVSKISHSNSEIGNVAWNTHVHGQMLIKFLTFLEHLVFSQNRLKWYTKKKLNKENCCLNSQKLQCKRFKTNLISKKITLHSASFHTNVYRKNRISEILFITIMPWASHFILFK